MAFIFVEMANYTTHFNLMYLNQNQIAKDVVINQNIQVIDNLMHIKVTDFASSPPSSLNEGDAYIVRTGASGIWTGFDNNIAIFQNNAWIFIRPTCGTICNVLYWYGRVFYDGYNWRVADTMPKIGDYKLSAQTGDHDNWMLCDGRAVQRSKYNQLFGMLSTKFGTGDGSTTFNIPRIVQNTFFQNTFVFYGLV